MKKSWILMAALMSVGTVSVLNAAAHEHQQGHMSNEAIIKAVAQHGKVEIGGKTYEIATAEEAKEAGARSDAKLTLTKKSLENLLNSRDEEFKLSRAISGNVGGSTIKMYSFSGHFLYLKPVVDNMPKGPMSDEEKIIFEVNEKGEVSIDGKLYEFASSEEARNAGVKTDPAHILTRATLKMQIDKGDAHWKIGHQMGSSGKVINSDIRFYRLPDSYVLYLKPKNAHMGA